MPLLINTVVAERDSVVKTRNRIQNSEFREKSHSYENYKKILDFFFLYKLQETKVQIVILKD